MVTIKTIDDFIKFKDFAISPICYVYYKESLLNAYYVGFTTQHAYYYLRNHHKMKKIKDVINNGYSIQVYTKYNEDSLIKLFKPKLNIIKGTGICGRIIKRDNTIYLGEIIVCKTIRPPYKKRQIYNQIYKGLYSLYDTLWDNLFKNKNEFVSIAIDSKIVKYLIEKEKLKDNQKYNQIINNELFIQLLDVFQ